MTKKIIMVLAALLMALTWHGLAAEKTNVTGKWEITSQSPRGERTSTVEMTQEGEKVKLVMQGRRGRMEAEGTVKGDKIEWTFTRENPRGTFTITYKGTVSGDTMKGEATTPRGSISWSAKRIGTASEGKTSAS